MEGFKEIFMQVILPNLLKMTLLHLTMKIPTPSRLGVTFGGSGGVSYFVNNKLALVVPIVSSNLFALEFSQTKNEVL
jgi:hypothetical protein